jgi:transcription elongation factor GreB
MSKAFTKESDADDELPRRSPLESLLPPGAKNYLTTSGAEMLREELTRLIQVERPRHAAGPDDAPDAARERRRQIDDRIVYLEHSLQRASVVPPPDTSDGMVRFGASVRVRWPDGEEESLAIVGVDEADPAQGRISWVSPMARALVDAKAGQRVQFQAPAGRMELLILSVGTSETE